MTSNESLRAAEKAHQQGNLKEAEQAYIKILNQGKNNDATFGLATLYSQSKKYDQAIELFTTALTEEPLALDINLNFVMCLYAANSIDQAVQIISNIESHLPNDAYIINSFARLSLSLKQPALAIKVAKRYPTDNSQTLTIVATAYMQSENWTSAIAVWKKLSILPISQVNIQKSLSLCYAKIREYKNAIKAFQAFLEHTEVDSANFLRFADLYILARDIKQARIQLDKAISYQDTSLTRYEIEVRVCRFENNEKQALIAAEAALKLNPLSYIAWGAKQEIGGHYQQTITQLQPLCENPIENNYENQQNLFILAKAYEKLGHYEQAFTSFSKANSLQERVINESQLSYHFLEEEKHLEFLRQVSAPLNYNKQSTPNNIFIVGMPRSGTTLMDRILSQHPEVQSSGENEALALFIENKINAQKQNKDVDWTAIFQDERESYKRSYFAKTDLKAEIIVDKMPHNFRYVGAILSIFQQAKVIQMRRTPQDLALSIFSQPFAPHHNYAANLKTIAHAIFHANKLMDFWRDSFPEQVIDVDYNQLTNEPSQTANAIFDFCHLTWQDEYLNFHKKHVSSFTFSELQVRQPINTTKQNFARHYEKELAIFNDFYAELSQSNCR